LERGKLVLASSHERIHREGVVAHHVAGVVHFLDVDGSLDDALEAIWAEIERCEVRALVVETAEKISAADAQHIVAVLAETGSRWQVGTNRGPGAPDAAIDHRLQSDDGREVLLTSA
jgi:hypothetical protein